ncbi:hypothetical protein AOQ84DRAFT_422418 [Glonium stellatum]|uniref:Uncharacterized protein n=1 Tax=Glonium stellatum TaxID=574774 RepID=A0A8E2JMI6_9PEZI|nr:hypothetical protein AOQ84DRAFT_422418 [Glonium stellatum]
MSLLPPFESKNSLRSLDDCMKVLPAAITCGNKRIRPKRALNEFVQLDLLTPRLDKIYRYLWLAGEPTPARPLHRQRLLRREIVVTQNPDEHLVEDRAVIFIKPLPEYLLSFEFWITHLSSDRNLHQSACGLLLSYVWIVAYHDDMRIAQETHLLPKSVDWAAWKDFVEDFLEHVGASTPPHVSKRYNYGELWLRHLNVIYKFSPSTFSVGNLHDSFLNGPMWYGFFIERNLTRLFAIFAFLSLGLSAMQVGQATPELRDSAQFSRASYGFSVATLFLILFSVLGVILAWTVPRGFRLLARRWLKRRLTGIS